MHTCTYIRLVPRKRKLQDAVGQGAGGDIVSDRFLMIYLIGQCDVKSGSIAQIYMLCRLKTTSLPKHSYNTELSK